MSTKDVKELAIEQAKKFGGKLEVSEMCIRDRIRSLP